MRWIILCLAFILSISISLGDDQSLGGPLQLQMMDGPVTVIEPSGQGSGNSYQTGMMLGPVNILDTSGQGQQVKNSKGIVTDLKISPLPYWKLNASQKKQPSEGSFELYPIPGWVLGSGNQGQQNQPSGNTEEPGKVTITEGSITVYYAGQMIPLANYQLPEGNYLWIETMQGWTQYISIPQHSGLSLIACAPAGGQGMIYEIYPSTSYQGSYMQNAFNFNPGYSRLYFKGEIAGRHVLTFVLGNLPSNSIVIDVIGPSAQGAQPILGTGKGAVGDV